MKLLCVMQHYGTIAGLILLDEEVTSKFSSAGVDEIFFHRTPILTVVDPDSMAVGVCERSEDRTGESWNSVLTCLPNLRYVISDEARGIGNGVYLTSETILHQNMKTFKQGRRKGKSPFQLLGVDFGNKDWIQLMEGYQLAA